MDTIRELSKSEVTLTFAASCVESVARALSLPYQQVYARMNRADMFDKLIFPYYETIHSESRETITQRLIDHLNTFEKTNA